jgi:hypothetical protein
MHAHTRSRRIAGFAAAPVAIIIAGLLVWQGSNAAFTAQTRSIGNSWDTGSVFLTDDDSGTAAFSLTNVTPGQTGSRCLQVTSNSTVPGVVKVYLARLGAAGLENNITVSTEIGTGGTFGSCASFVATEPALPALTLNYVTAHYNDYATGVLPWTTAGTAGETKSYRVTWTFDTTGLTQTQIDALQGKSVSADVIWELQTN